MPRAKKKVENICAIETLLAKCVTKQFCQLGFKPKRVLCVNTTMTFVDKIDLTVLQGFLGVILDVQILSLF